MPPCKYVNGGKPLVWASGVGLKQKMQMMSTRSPDSEIKKKQTKKKCCKR